MIENKYQIEWEEIIGEVMFEKKIEKKKEIAKRMARCRHSAARFDNDAMADAARAIIDMNSFIESDPVSTLYKAEEAWLALVAEALAILAEHNTQNYNSPNSLLDKDRIGQLATQIESVEGLIFQEVVDASQALKERKTKIQNELETLLEIWKASMAKASGERRTQKAETIEHLFLEADLLNPILQLKALRWAEKCGARYHKASVKSEARALQKVSRSYHRKWRHLCDLVRVAIDCKSLADLCELLKEICDDDEVVLLKLKNEKMRFQDKIVEGGYRDIQLSLSLCSDEVKKLGIQHHVIEVQLHLESLYELKSEEGHKSYVRARNLRGL